MSLQTRIGALITAIGADVKALQNRVDNKHNASITSQTLGTGDTYLAGSAIAIPTGKIKVGTKYRCRFNVVKTNAGLAAPIINIRVGTLQSVLDSSRAALSFAAQTAVIDEGTIEIDCAFRVAGASAVLQAVGRLWHRLVTTGLNVTAVHTSVVNTGGAAEVTSAGLIIGVSVNAGASSAWTIQLVSAELVNLTP